MTTKEQGRCRKLAGIRKKEIEITGERVYGRKRQEEVKRKEETGKKQGRAGQRKVSRREESLE